MLTGRDLGLPKGAVILIGVMGEHDSAEAEAALDNLTAWLATMPVMPLLWRHIASDCLVSPVERGSRHFEVRWIEV